MEHILAIVGLSSVGKSTFANLLQSNYGYDIYEIGTYVRRGYQVSANRSTQTLLEYANDCYRLGKLIDFTKRALDDSMASIGNIAFCGLRTYEDIVCIKQFYPKMMIVKVICSKQNRLLRYSKESHDKVSLQNRDDIESTWIKDCFESISIDFTLENNGSIEDFYSVANNLVISNNLF